MSDRFNYFQNDLRIALQKIGWSHGGFDHSREPNPSTRFDGIVENLWGAVVKGCQSKASSDAEDQFAREAIEYARMLSSRLKPPFGISHENEEECARLLDAAIERYETAGVTDT